MGSGTAWTPGPCPRGGLARRRAMPKRARPRLQSRRSCPGTPGGASRRRSWRHHPFAVDHSVLGAVHVDRVVARAAVDLVELAVAGVDDVVAGRTLLHPVAHVDLS